MNKIIQQLIRELLKESDDEKKKKTQTPKGYLSIRNVSSPVSNTVFGPMAHVARQLKKGASSGTAAKKSDNPEVEMAVTYDEDRFASIFEQIKSEPRYFSIGNSITVNRNEIVLSQNQGDVSLEVKKNETRYPGTVNLAVYGSFSKGIAVKHANDLISPEYVSAMDPPGGPSIGATIAQEPATQINVSNNVDPAVISNIEAWINALNQVGKNNYNQMVPEGVRAMPNSLKELVLLWADACNSTTFLHGKNRWHSNPTQEHVKKLNSLASKLDHGELVQGNSKTKTDIPSAVYQTMTKQEKDSVNEIFNRAAMKTQENFRNFRRHLFEMFFVSYRPQSFCKVLEKALANLKGDPNFKFTAGTLITKYIKDYYESGVAASLASQQVSIQQLQQQRDEEAAAIDAEYSTYDPVNVLQTPASAGRNASDATKQADAMLQFAHAAKGKVTSDLSTDENFASDLIDLNVNQFSQLLNEFKPEVVIIPGSSSQFNTDYFNRIKQEVSRLDIDIQDYSSFKSTHIISYDVDDALIDQISQQTREATGSTAYRTRFWDANPDDAKKYYINSIHTGFSEAKNYETLSKQKMHYLVARTIREAAPNTPADRPRLIKIIKDKIKKEEEPKSLVIIKNTIDVADLLKYTDVESTVFRDPDLEAARKVVAQEINESIDFFRTNGYTSVTGNLHRVKIAEPVKKSKDDRLRRMSSQAIESSYTIDKKKKTSKTISEMGALKISELGALGSINQTKRIFLKDMHLLIDLKNLEGPIRSNIIDILNSFASAAYNAYMGDIIDFTTKNAESLVESANEMISEPDQRINDAAKQIGDLMVLFKDNIEATNKNPLSLINPSLPVVFKDFRENKESMLQSNNLDDASRDLLNRIYDFIVNNYVARAESIQAYINKKGESFEEFVAFYRDEVFKIISVTGDKLVSEDTFNQINELTADSLKLIKASYEMKRFDDIDFEYKDADFESAKADVLYIVSIAESIGHTGLGDIKFYKDILESAKEPYEVKAEAIQEISKIISETKEDDPRTLTDENKKLENLIKKYQKEYQNELAIARISKNIELLENKPGENNEPGFKDKIQEKLKEDRFFEKSIATILYEFARSICVNKDSMSIVEGDKFDLSKTILKDSSLTPSINASLKEKLTTAIEIEDRKIVILPILDVGNDKIHFSAKSIQDRSDFSFSIDFDLVAFIYDRIDQTNKIVSDVYDDFSNIGFKRPKSVLLIDDNVSSGGTFAMIAKSILEMQQKEGCFFKFDDRKSFVETQFLGSLESFSLDDVRPANNKALTHIIGLTPIFI